ncbi:MAG: hypothetical protein ACXW2U_00195 [Telluria sp.]
MITNLKGAAKRLILSLLLGAGMAGCAVYAPPYSAYDSYPYNQGYSTYVGPPVTLDLGFGFYDYGHSYYRGHSGYHRGHGYRGHQHGGRGHHGGRGRGRR